MVLNSHFQALSAALVLRLHEKLPLHMQLHSLFCVIALLLCLVQLRANGAHRLHVEKLRTLLLHE